MNVIRMTKVGIIFEYISTFKLCAYERLMTFNVV